MCDTITITETIVAISECHRGTSHKNQRAALPRRVYRHHARCQACGGPGPTDAATDMHRRHRQL